MIYLNEFIEKMKLENCTPEIDISDITIENSDINRPALQLAGFYDYFDHRRIQIIGNVENAYLHSMDKDERLKMLEKLLSYSIPCIVFCRNFDICDDFLIIATKNNIPILRTIETTTNFTAETIRWLKVNLAPSIAIHGVLVDVYGEGVLITGDSGAGKSETALELVKRGHRLVADDVVDIKKVSDETLVGSAPIVTKNLIELRGIGIIDVKTLFGVASIKESQSISLNIHLENWKEDKNYDRIGLDVKYTEILGNKIVQNKIPITPGRNLAIIIETAAINYRQRILGYNAAEELIRRVNENMEKGTL